MHTLPLFKLLALAPHPPIVHPEHDPQSQVPPEDVLIYIGGGTICSTNRRGSLSPTQGCDSSQITRRHLDDMRRFFDEALEQHSKVIYLMGTDTAGNVGDAIADWLAQSRHAHNNKSIVLTTAMDPSHKDNAVYKAKQCFGSGVFIVATACDGIAHEWHLSDVSVRKIGSDSNLPFVAQPKGSFAELDNGAPSFLKHPKLSLVLPSVHDTEDDIHRKLDTAAAKQNTHTLVLVGFGLFNFPQPPKVLDRIKELVATGPVFVSTRTQAYFEMGHDTFTPYEPLATLLSLGVKPYAHATEQSLMSATN